MGRSAIAVWSKLAPGDVINVEERAFRIVAPISREHFKRLQRCEPGDFTAPIMFHCYLVEEVSRGNKESTSNMSE